MPRYFHSSTLSGIKRIDWDAAVPEYDYRQGRQYWDTTDYTLSVGINDGVDTVVQQIGQETQAYIRNNTGSDIPNGYAGYANGSAGYRITAALSRADDILTSNVQGVTTQAIGNNTSGIVTTFGIVRDFDTDAWTEGDLLYLSPTVSGELQNTPPTSGFCIVVGRVLRKHPTDGAIFVFPRHVPAFGNLIGGNYSQIEFDGSIRSFGDGVCWRDELQPLISSVRIETPAADISTNPSEGTLTFETGARYPTDYVVTSLQLNHDWSSGTSIKPHLHWWQTTASVPNWLIEHRWQKQGDIKTTSWTPIVWNSNAFTWTAGTLNQITGFGEIAPPSGYGDVSDIVQLKLYRDYTNVSTLFGGADPVALDVDAVNFDTHLRNDMFGSHEEYSK